MTTNRRKASTGPDGCHGAAATARGGCEHEGTNSRHGVALCMEEMVAYAVAANEGKDISAQVSVRFMSDSAMFTILDDGEYIALVEGRENQELITNIYDLVKRIANEVNYQRVLDLNYTIMRFSEGARTQA